MLIREKITEIFRESYLYLASEYGARRIGIYLEKHF